VTGHQPTKPPEGRRSARTVKGVLRLTARGYGFIDRQDGSSVFISAREANKAFDGDLVQVELHDSGHEAGPEGRNLQADRSRRSLLLGRLHRRGGQWLAEVKTGPLSFEARAQVDGHFPKSGEWALFQAPETRDRHPLPLVQVNTILGNPRKQGVAEHALLLAYGFKEEYPEEPVLESIRLRVPRDRAGQRRDLRGEFVVTIDPTNARDHDDAVSLTKDERGVYHLGVHIADVSRYVQVDTAIDREARERGFSVYLQQHHLPMLPPRLPAEMCSLKPGKDRLALSVLMRFDENGSLLSSEITPSRISISRLIAYEQAQEYIENPPRAAYPPLPPLDKGGGKGKRRREEDDPELGEKIRLMWELASTLRKKRMAEGGINFELPEPGFEWDDTAAPVSIFREASLESHKLIEEFMLAANRAVATLWAEKFGDEAPNVYRVHPPPDAAKRQKLSDYLREAGFDWPASRLTTDKQIADMLNEAERRFPLEITTVIARKALTLARYDAKALGHFGLGFQKYLHFTSPIRRYADLSVHRLLWDHLIYGRPVADWEELSAHIENLCQHLTTRERVISEIEREGSKLAGLLYLDAHRDRVYDAILVEAYQENLYVALEDLYIEGMMAPESRLRYQPRSERRKQKSRRERDHTVSFGDRLQVKVHKIDLLNRKLELMPV
jgi:ribonuclease R